MNKDRLVNLLIQLISDKEVMFKKIYNDFKSTLALLPAELEGCLNITANERKKWTENK